MNQDHLETATHPDKQLHARNDHAVNPFEAPTSDQLPQPVAASSREVSSWLVYIDQLLILLLIVACPTAVWLGGMFGWMDAIPQMGTGVALTGFVWIGSAFCYRAYLPASKQATLVVGGLILLSWSILFFISQNKPIDLPGRHMLELKDEHRQHHADRK